MFNYFIFKPKKEIISSFLQAKLIVRKQEHVSNTYKFKQRKKMSRLLPGHFYLTISNYKRLTPSLWEGEVKELHS